MLQAAANGGAGGLVTKTISVNPADVPRPCMAEIKGGFLNTELWSELPKEQWIETEYKLARETGLPVIVGLGLSALAAASWSHRFLLRPAAICQQGAAAE